MASRHRLDGLRRYGHKTAQDPTKEIEIATDYPVPREQPRTETIEQEPYLADDKLEDAVNLAIALGRPLLLQGEPGSGKTRLAHAVAYAFGYPIEECYIKSTTRAQELLYTYDAVNRLYDSQLGQAGPPGPDGRPKSAEIGNYIRLGPLGRAIARASYGRPSVVLIDEIDKADLDFPNDLLREVDRLEFDVPEAPEMRFRVPVEKPEWRPILFVTHNEEKALPTAFLRRCIFHYVEFPKDHRHLEDILREHHPEFPAALTHAAVTELEALRKLSLNKPPGISELIDWVTYVHDRGLAPAELAKRPHIGALLKHVPDQEKALAGVKPAQP